MKIRIAAAKDLLNIEGHLMSSITIALSSNLFTAAPTGKILFSISKLLSDLNKDSSICRLSHASRITVASSSSEVVCNS